jgi:hypothetical protein
MPSFTMKCSVCEKTFELDSPALPVDELAPKHTAMHSGRRGGEVPCAGTGQVLVPASS